MLVTYRPLARGRLSSRIKPPLRSTRRKAPALVIALAAAFAVTAASATADPSVASKQAEAQKSVDFFLHIIPDTVVGAFATGEILQVLLFSILFGFALMGLGERGHTLRAFIDDAAHAPHIEQPERDGQPDADGRIEAAEQHSIAK